jgi:hypothetical protein
MMYCSLIGKVVKKKEKKNSHSRGNKGTINQRQNFERENNRF